MRKNENESNVVRYGLYAATLGLVAKGLNDLRSLQVKDIVQSSIFKRWKRFNEYLVSAGWIPPYHPKGINGKRLTDPSNSPPVYHTPPAMRQDSLILRPFKLRGLTLRNRVIRAAAFDGEKEEEIIQTHVEQSKGGVGMTTVAYCCVSSEGRTFDSQLLMEEKRREFLVRLTTEVHKYGGAICAQLTHAGGFADRAVTGTRQLAPSSVFNIAGFDWPKAMSLEELEETARKFAEAAILAKETGFDCVEIHVGHGYLLSQFICPRANVRTDKYGGSAANRARFPAEVVERCRAAVGEDFPIVVKLNMHDGHSNGLELDDAIVAADMLADASADALILTCGSVTLNGLYMLRGEVPMEKLAQALPSRTEQLAVALFGPIAIPKTEYDDCFLRESAREVLKRVGHKVSVCLLGGVSSLSAMEGAMQEGFELVQIARTLIREPDFMNRIQAALKLNEEVEEESRDVISDVTSKCIRCNMCVVATVDPSASFGCPFQRLDAKTRNSKDMDSVLSVADMTSLLKDEAASSSIARNPTSGIAVQDIEDYFLSSKAKL